MPIRLKVMTNALTDREELDIKAQKALSELAEILVDDVVEFACRLAKHRGQNVLHRNDVRLAFEKKLKVKVPTKMHQALGTSGQTSSAGRPTGMVPVLPSQPISTDKYKSKLNLVKKAEEHHQTWVRAKGTIISRAN